MQPLLLADHLALDFINTELAPRGTSIELIGDGRAFVDWLVAAGVLDRAGAVRLRRRFGAAALDELATEARRLRRFATDWLARWRADPEASYEPELRRLNDLLARGNDYRELVQRDGRFALEVRRRGDTTDELLAVLAAQIAELVVHEQPALVKQCDAAQCTLWFLDRTKAHRRRFCSVAVCGNREKVAAFRARQRQASAGGRTPRVARDPRDDDDDGGGGTG